ncbi:MAG: hypothetical protein GXO94_01710 [Nitrospirae bacterium]|nr:hypothetical protein [Nitrospirota bacterium]
MNPRFYHKIPADFLTGKAILILIVTLCSALSFLLGYFVGKSRLEEGPTPVSMNTRAEDFRAPYQERQQQEDETAGHEENGGSGTMASVMPVPDSKEPTRTGKKAAVGKKDVRKTAVGAKTAPERRVSARYTIQVGAFRGKEQAERLKERLRKKGYSVKVVAAGKKRTIYRVWVGRFGSRKAAETAAIKLTRAEKLKTLVLKTDR